MRAWVGSHRFRVVIVVVLAVVVVAAAQGVRAYIATGTERAGAAALAAASVQLPAVLSYSVATLDADLAKGRSFITGPFEAEYSKLVTEVINPVGRDKQVVTSATVAAAGVTRAGLNEVDLLVYVNQQSSSLEQPTPRLDQSRVKVTMTKSGGRWLISGLTPL